MYAGGWCANWYNFLEEEFDNIYQNKRSTDSLTKSSHFQEFILKIYLYMYEILAFQCIHGSMIVNVQ